MIELGWPANLLAEDDRARLARYEEAAAFFSGDQWLRPRKPGETRLTLNYARALLRKVASYVFPAEPRFSVPVDGDQAVANRAERALAEIVAHNGLVQLDIELCVAAAVRGDAAIKVSWDAPRKRAVVAAVDPATMVVEAAPDDPRRIIEIVQCYGLRGSQIATVFDVAPLHLDPRRHYQIVERWSDDRWTVTVADQRLRDEPNPYGWIPYVVLTNHPALSGFWGESDLADLYDICRELNRRMSVLSRVLELSGAPIAVLENVDGSEGVTVGPGAKWELPEGSRAYLLDLLGNGGVSLHIDYISQLFRALQLSAVVV